VIKTRKLPKPGKQLINCTLYPAIESAKPRKDSMSLSQRTNGLHARWDLFECVSPTHGHRNRSPSFFGDFEPPRRNRWGLWGKSEEFLVNCGGDYFYFI
jgi:hypothetical protein